jgi:dynein light intermediate chain 1
MTISTSNVAIPSIDTHLTSSPIGVNQPPGGGPSHEVLANFFQSLLVKKASTTSGSSSPNTTLLGSSLNGRDTEEGTSSPQTSSGTTRRPTISRKDVHKELDRMRQYVNKP